MDSDKRYAQLVAGFVVALSALVTLMVVSMLL
jgi:hypothetical protein